MAAVRDRAVAPVVRVLRRALFVVGTAGVLGGAFTAMVAQLTVPVDAESPIGQVWSEQKAELGPAVVPERCAPGGETCAQQFRHGWAHWSAQTGAHTIVDGPLAAEYEQRGSAEGELGLPITDAEEDDASGVRWQGFEHGGLFAGSGKGVLVVEDTMWEGWQDRAASPEAIGFPLSNERRDRRGVSVQTFENGVMYVRDGSPVATLGAIGAAHDDLAGQYGDLGYPTEPEQAAGDGRLQWFEGGAIWLSPEGDAVAVFRGVLNEYLARGAEGGDLGFPVAEQEEIPGGIRQQFTHGWLYLSEADGQAHATFDGNIEVRYEETGGPEGPLGLPIGERSAVHGGYMQSFSGGAILWREGIGSLVLDQESVDAWAAHPGVLGWPTADSWSDDRGVHVAFESGEAIRQGQRFYSTEPIDENTAVILCDSQCDGDSWVERGARANGFSGIVERSYPGGGYAAASAVLDSSVTAGLENYAVMLPQGSPGVVILSLGGNDLAQGKTPTEVAASMERMVALVREAYPDTPIVVNGIISRRDAVHAFRRDGEAMVLAQAERLGLLRVSVAGWVSDYSAPQKDDVHLAPAGHERIGPVYASALAAVLGR